MKLIIILSIILAVSICAALTTVQERSQFLNSCRSTCVTEISTAIGQLTGQAKTDDVKNMNIWKKCTNGDDGGEDTKNVDYEYSSCSHMEFTEGLFVESLARYKKCYGVCTTYPTNAKVKRTESATGSVEKDYTLKTCIQTYCKNEAEFEFFDKTKNSFAVAYQENKKCHVLCRSENDTKLSFAEKDERDYFIKRVYTCLSISPTTKYDYADGDETLNGKQKDLIQSLSCQIFRQYDDDTIDNIEYQYSKQYFMMRETCYNYCKEREQVNSGNRKNEHVNTVLKCFEGCHQTFYENTAVGFDKKRVQSKFVESFSSIMTISIALFALLALII